MAENLSDTIINALPDLVLVVRRDGIIVGNLGGCDVGVVQRPGQLLGTSLNEIWTEEIATHLHQLVRRTLKSRTTVEHCYAYQNRHYEVRVRPHGIDRVLMVLRGISGMAEKQGGASVMESSNAAILESRAAFLERLGAATIDSRLRETRFAVAVVHLGGLGQIGRALGDAAGES